MAIVGVRRWIGLGVILRCGSLEPIIRVKDGGVCFIISVDAWNGWVLEVGLFPLSVPCLVRHNL